MPFEKLLKECKGEISKIYWSENRLVVIIELEPGTVPEKKEDPDDVPWY